MKLSILLASPLPLLAVNGGQRLPKVVSNLGTSESTSGPDMEAMPSKPLAAVDVERNMLSIVFSRLDLFF